MHEGGDHPCYYNMDIMEYRLLVRNENPWEAVRVVYGMEVKLVSGTAPYSGACIPSLAEAGGRGNCQGDAYV